MRALVFAALVSCTSSDPSGTPTPPCAVTQFGPRPSDARCAPTSPGVTCCTRIGFQINSAERCTDFASRVVLHCDAVVDAGACVETGVTKCVATSSGTAFTTSSSWSAPGFVSCTEEQRAAQFNACAAR
jgi:hypothetical protein